MTSISMTEDFRLGLLAELEELHSHYYSDEELFERPDMPYTEKFIKMLKEA